MKKLKVNVVSEFQYLWKAQGVGTAFFTTVDMLRNTDSVEVHVNSLKTCDILHGISPGPLFSALKPLYPGRRVLSAHVVPESFHMSLPLWRQIDPIVTRIIVRSFNTADLLISVAPAVTRNLKSRGVRTPQVVIPNAIDLSHFRRDPGLRTSGRTLLGLGPDTKVVLGVGLICLRKGFDEFIEVARMNPGFTFVWVGGSSFSLFTDAYFKKHEWITAAPRNVRFPGILPFERMPEVYNAADLLFLPTRQETFGLVIAEAAACGLPLVVRDLPDFRELFGDAHLGAEGCNGFSECIRSVFSDPGLAESLRRKGLAMAQRLDSRSLATKLVEAYVGLYMSSRNGKLQAA